MRYFEVVATPLAEFNKVASGDVAVAMQSLRAFGRYSQSVLWSLAVLPKTSSQYLRLQISGKLLSASNGAFRERSSCVAPMLVGAETRAVTASTKMVL
jgi:hypothetical protein